MPTCFPRIPLNFRLFFFVLGLTTTSSSFALPRLHAQLWDFLFALSIQFSLPASINSWTRFVLTPTTVLHATLCRGREPLLSARCGILQLVDGHYAAVALHFTTTTTTASATARTHNWTRLWTFKQQPAALWIFCAFCTTTSPGLKTLSIFYSESIGLLFRRIIFPLVSPTFAGYQTAQHALLLSPSLCFLLVRPTFQAIGARCFRNTNLSALFGQNFSAAVYLTDPRLLSLDSIS